MFHDVKLEVFEFQMPPNVKGSGNVIIEGKMDKTTIKEEYYIKGKRWGANLKIGKSTQEEDKE